MAISKGLEDNTQLACSDGSCIDGSGSHGWVIAHDSGDIIAQGSGPTDSHPSLVSSFREELGGLLAVLYVMHRVCQYYHVQEGKASIFCDNKGALTHVFNKCITGISAYQILDYDLIVTMVTTSCPSYLLLHLATGLKDITLAQIRESNTPLTPQLTT